MYNHIYDYIILGAGPAGLQLGYLMHSTGWDYLILEAGEGPGNFFRTFPRHRKLISINKRHTGYQDPELRLRMDWNSLLSDDPRLLFPNYSASFFPRAEDLVRYLETYSATFSLNVRYATRVERVARPDVFELGTADGETYRCRRLIVATGLSQPYLPDIPGIGLADTYVNASVDPRDYLDLRVLVIGKGNSAFETADNLVETTAVIHVAGPRAVQFAWRTHFVGHLRAVNNNILDTYQLKSQNAILDANVVSIERRGDKLAVVLSFVRADELHKELLYDRVIACTGFRFDASLFDEACRPELVIDGRFPAQTPGWESVNVPDLFFAGTLMQQRDYKKSTSAFIHGFRYCVRSLHRMLADRYHGTTWPRRTIRRDPRSLTETVIERVNRTSALWQLFGYLADVLICHDDQADYLEEVPVDYVHEGRWGHSDNYFLITLEYGPNHASVDPFDINVVRVAQDDADHASAAHYLHPVIRHYSRGRLLAEHHVAENLENLWNGPAHIQPLERFFAGRLARTEQLQQAGAASSW
jgi:thioredoxin reductase